MFQAIAILMMLGFYGVYFGKMLAQRRQGIQTDQMGKGDKPAKVLWTERLVKLATLLIVPVEILSIALVSPTPGWLRWTGAGLGALGVAIFAISVLTMRDSWRAGIPEQGKTSLVTGGIYGWSRNPAFFGFDLVYVGVLLMFFNLPLLLGTLFAMVMLHLQILQEEVFLTEAFGQEYEAYRRRTARYWGRK